jgi:outer membrane protein TolC
MRSKPPTFTGSAMKAGFPPCDAWNGRPVRGFEFEAVRLRSHPTSATAPNARGRTEHPLITTATYNVDIAVQQVKIAGGALYPTLSAVGNVQKTFGSTGSLAILETLSASVGAQLSVPIYQGGSETDTLNHD